MDSMGDKRKKEEQLISELESLRRRVAELEESNTACKNRQDSLWESAEKYRLLIENSHDIIYMLTPDGVFTFVSPGWTTLLGHPVIQVVGKPFQQFVHPDDIARCEIFLQRVIETGQRQTGVEYRVSHADGYWRWHTTNAVPLKDEAGTVVGFEGIASDITERKRAEDALKESEQKLTNIIDFLPDATFVIDRDKKVVAWNRAMEEMTGVKKEDMIGQGSYAGSVPFYGERRPYLLELIDANDKELESKYEYVQKKGNTLYAEGFTPALYGGKGAYLWATGAPLFDGRGNRIGAIESIRDITDRKLAEGELVWKTAFLEAQVEATIDGILVVDGKGKKILANQHLLDIWKVPQHIRDDKDDTSLLQYVTSITRYPEQFLEKVVYLYAHPNETSRDEIEFKDGMVMDRYSSPVSGKDGKYYGRIWTFRDITARKRVEEKLRENEEKFSKTFHASPYAITITRPEDGKFVEVNDAFISITGFTRGEALASASIGLKLWVNEDDRQRVVADLQAGRAFVGQEFQFRAKSGEVITGLFSAQMIQLSNGPCILSSINDITERKKAEEALRESQQIIEEIINAIPVRVFWKNKNLVYLGCNAVFAHDAGFADPKDIIGKDDYQMGWRDQAELYRGDDRQVIESGCSKFLIEEPQTTPEGNTITLLTSKIPLRSSKGEISGVLGTYMDITERKRAEEALREGEQRLHSIIDGSPIPAFVIGKDHLVIHWNKALEEISSIKSEEVVGTCAHWRAFYNVERPCMADLLVDEAVELVPQWYSGKYVKSPLFEDAYEATDFFPALGENGKWLRFTAGAIRDSKGIVLAAIETLEDITVRKLAEEKYRSIFENAVMGIFQSTPDGRIISANPAFARLLGYESPEAVVNTITDMARQMYVTPERHSELLNLMNEQGTIEGHEIQFSRKDRSIIWTNMNGRAVRDNSKKLLYYEGTIQDITDRKVLESHLRQAQKMEAIGTLAGGIAHDFNNILGAILGYTEMALTHPKVDDRLRRYLNQVYTAGERATDLVKQILAFSRQSDEKPRPLRVSPIIKEVLKLLRASLPTTITIRQDIQSDLDTVLADPTQLHQILMNLCTNAAHAMRGRKGELKVSLVPVEIKPRDSLIIIHGLTPDMYLKLTVSDAGVGIAPDIMDRIFDPFFTTKKPSEGTGLGLSVIHGIVKSYHGAITMESEVGKGTEFHVYLPLLKETGEKREVEAVADITGGKERILFVDDEEVLVELGKSMLTGLGYDVIGRTSSLEALELFRARPERFDLVITDMTMPNMTGIELARELMRIRPGIPIILCTGFSETITPEKAKTLGLREFIMKPIIKIQIAEAIRRVLDQKEQG